MSAEAEERRPKSRAERRQRQPARRINLTLAAAYVKAADAVASGPESDAIPVSAEVRALVRGHQRAQERRVKRRKASKQARKRSR